MTRAVLQNAAGPAVTAGVAPGGLERTSLPAAPAKAAKALRLLRSFATGVSRKAARHYRSKPFRMRNPAPLVSFTFDDVPDSAYRNGADILEQHGLRGTFYIASGTCDTDDEHWHLIDHRQVRALHDRGHELGCHTFSHVNVETLDTAGMESERRRNRDLLQRLCPDLQVTNFCYPFGRLSLARKLQLQNEFDTCRGVYEGINAGTVDLGLLRVIELYDRTLTGEKLARVLREAKARNGWIVFYTHDVADPPSWIGCSPAIMRRTVEAVQAAGLSCLPIRDALKEIGYSARRAQPAIMRC
jgi:peptidoglycan/xylan/chitin deacetylase (PgdA/CDA1 family)